MVMHLTFDSQLPVSARLLRVSALIVHFWLLPKYVTESRHVMEEFDIEPHE